MDEEETKTDGPMIMDADDIKVDVSKMKALSL